MNKSSFILKPKNSEQANSVTNSDMLRCIDPVVSKINIANIGNARNGDVVVSCIEDGESANFEDIAKEKLGDKYDVKRFPVLNPRLNIVGLSEKLENDVLLKYIKKQKLFGVKSRCKIINVTHLRKNRNVFQAIIQLDAVTYKKVLNCGKLFVGYDYCSIYDAIDLRRYFKCCGYHHIADGCSASALACPKCSEGHYVRDCKATYLKCVHCVKLKLNQNLDIGVDHAVWDPGCYVYKEFLTKFRANILGVGGA